jgi:hypothetical protein
MAYWTLGWSLLGKRVNTYLGTGKVVNVLFWSLYDVEVVLDHNGAKVAMHDFECTVIKEVK